jgi:hypothetical protein
MNVWYPGCGLDLSPLFYAGLFAGDEQLTLIAVDYDPFVGNQFRNMLMLKGVDLAPKMIHFLSPVHRSAFQSLDVRAFTILNAELTVNDDIPGGWKLEVDFYAKLASHVRKDRFVFFQADAFETLKYLKKQNEFTEVAVFIGNRKTSRFGPSAGLDPRVFFDALATLPEAAPIKTLWTDLPDAAVSAPWNPTGRVIEHGSGDAWKTRMATEYAR